MPLDWVRQCFRQLVAALLTLGTWPDQDLPVGLLDGSTKRLRPQGDIGQEFPAHRTHRRRAYRASPGWWLRSALLPRIATAARLASLRVSEQALAVELLLEEAQRVLHIGDRNFGVWRVVRAAVQSGGQALVRLTQVRARRLAGCRKTPAPFPGPTVVWSPSSRDQIDPGLRKEPVAGRLIIIQAQPRGYRPQTLYLFTTLTDVQAYPPQRLLELYGWR